MDYRRKTLQPRPAPHSSPATRSLRPQRGMSHHLAPRTSTHRRNRPYDPYEIPDDDDEGFEQNQDVVMKYEDGAYDFRDHDEERDQDNRRLEEALEKMERRFDNFEQKMPRALQISVQAQVKKMEAGHQDLKAKLEAIEEALRAFSGRKQDFREMSKRLQETLDENSKKTDALVQEALQKIEKITDTPMMPDFNLN